VQSLNRPGKKRLVACPQCKAMIEYNPDNPFRPFCSERCRLIDLGQWANESYTIAVPVQPDDLLDDSSEC
jgi:uncharacterized protein